VRGRRFSRLSFAVLTAITGAALIAAPAGVAAKPSRTVLPVPDPFVIPAGLGCSFDVGVAPIGSQAITEFDDGHIARTANADITMTNLEGTSSYVQRSNYHLTETYPDANTVLLEVSGRIFIQFFPGDVGPFGEVGEPGAMYAFVGTVSATIDLDTELYTSFSYEGTVTDLCAALAG
jgi:hypothetical protein